MTLLRTFFVSIAIAMAGVIAYAFATREQPAKTATETTAEGHALLGGVYVRDQIALESVGALQSGGTRTLINLRPDGEDQKQPASAAVESAATGAGLSYAYIPTPHGDIPDAVVDDLAKALAGTERPAVLYCRSGKRATRVWALAEASRSGGPSIPEIVAAVKSAGQTVDDLMPRIEKRFSERAPEVSG
ncbi:MAG: TIGR01244 family phosphatase [Hyphomicrobium sp.]|nr:TIGR01244 family phosphatase [Hyphomicrobium sp.]